MAAVWTCRASEPLVKIFSDQQNKSEQDVRGIAKKQATAGPVLGSSKENEAVTFEGVFIPASDSAKLAFFSDDGVSVFINTEASSLTQLGEGQPLPDLDKSFHVLSATLKKGVPYCLKILYKNVKYTGAGDVDGVTMFAFNGGGAVKEKYQQYLNFIRHTNADASHVNDWLNTSGDALEKDDDGDGQNDLSCCMGFKQSGATAVNNTAGLDLITTKAKTDAAFNILQTNRQQVFICKYLEEYETRRPWAGRANACPGFGFIIIETAGPSVLAHEWGHCQGLVHRDPPPGSQNLMHSKTGGSGRWINSAESAAFMPPAK